MSADLAIEGVVLRGRLGPVDLVLPAGRLTVVLGPNGAGKSTLLAVLAGLVAPHAGTVRLGTSDLGRTSPLARAAHTSWLPQHPRREEGVTALEAVAAARYRHREGRADRDRAALEALTRLGVGHLAPRPMDALSGGEAQRVRMAALVAQEASWWLLDEPMNHLDPAVRLALASQLVDRAADGQAIVLVSHDLGLLPHLGEAHVVLMVEGRVVHTGATSDPALLPALGAAFGVSLHRIELDDTWALVASGPA